MSLKEKLNIEKNSKIEDYALEFAEKIQLELIDSAQKGYSAYSIDLSDREYAHILRNTLFLECLRQLLDGCNVGIEVTEHTNIIFKNKYHRQKLLISW